MSSPATRIELVAEHSGGGISRRTRRRRRAAWTICTWTDKLPADCRVAADAILIVAAKSGANVRDLAEVFGGIYTLARPRPGLVPAPEPAVISAVAI